MDDYSADTARPQEPHAKTVGAPAGDPFVSLQGITKDFGATVANSEISLTVHPGEIIGLIGGNGAGKSTLMKILSGALTPTEGRLAFDSEELDFDHYSTLEAQRHGIRMVHQELSLCTNLSVAENFFVEAPQGSGLMPGWRNTYKSRARAALEDVFPGCDINVDARVGDLDLGERQMVEIARAAATEGVRLIVLDEPTSSLDQERSRQLRAFTARKARDNTAFIFISHKLQEVADVASQVAVLRNGRLVWRGDVSETSVDHLVELMGGSTDEIRRSASGSLVADRDALVRIGGRFTHENGADIQLYKGEIVGLAGLEGHGQKELLHAVFSANGKPSGDVQHSHPASFIAGDRQKEGIFPLWNVLSNISIGRISLRRAFSRISSTSEAEAAAKNASRLNLKSERFQSNITELSGGNQQKALVARALGAGSTIVLLDDPTRGVDIATKQDFYHLCGEAAQEGRTLIWHTTEDAELLACDRVLVFAHGRIVEELKGDEITEAAIVGASFSHVASGDAETRQDGRQLSSLFRRLVDAAPFLGLALVLGTMMYRNPAIASVFGLDLLLLPALSLVLVTAAQMFVVGGSEIDLGVGAFAGLTSVLAATILFSAPWLGALAMLIAVAAYGCLGGLIQARKIPAIVVTLGASFIWTGIGYSIQPTPGGSSPEWLSAAVNWSAGPLPASVLMIVAVGVVVALLDRSPLGVILRGFGNNASAMVRSGWSRIRFGVIRYLLAGLFAGLAGLTLTGINYSSDVNSGNSFTLLSVAAVVMGGCTLIGGIVSPVGVVCGAVTLALIGALLGTLNVSSDFNAATQGLVLIGLLVLRSLTARKGEEE